MIERVRRKMIMQEERLEGTKCCGHFFLDVVALNLRVKFLLPKESIIFNEGIFSLLDVYLYRLTNLFHKKDSYLLIGKRQYPRDHSTTCCV